MTPEAMPAPPLHVREAGGGPVAVLLLHAFPLHGAMWRPQMGTLRRRARLLAPDLPGCGLSPAPPTRGIAPPLDDYARRTLATVDDLRVDRVVLVGLGMGGQLALRLVDHLGARLLGMLLAGTDAAPERDEIRLRLHQLAAEVEAAGSETVASEFLPKLLGPTTQHLQPDLLEDVATMIRENTPAGMAAALRAMSGRPDSRPLLDRIRCPVVCVSGEEDAITPPEVARATAARLFGGRFETIPAVGHLANLEAPRAFDDLLQGLLVECLPVS